MKAKIDDRVTQQPFPALPDIQGEYLHYNPRPDKSLDHHGLFRLEKKPHTKKKRHFQSIPIETVRAVPVNVVSELIVYCSV